MVRALRKPSYGSDTEDRNKSIVLYSILSSFFILLLILLALDGYGTGVENISNQKLIKFWWRSNGRGSDESFGVWGFSIRNQSGIYYERK